MQAGDFRDLFDPAMPQPHRFTPGDPSSLLFVEPIQQSMELSMFIACGMFYFRSTCRTTTFSSSKLYRASLFDRKWFPVRGFGFWVFPAAEQVFGGMLEHEGQRRQAEQFQS